MVDNKNDESSELDQLSYTRIHDQQCPYCKGTDICSPRSFMTLEKVYVGDKAMLRQRAECENCGRAWWDVFVLSYIEELAEGEE